MVTLGRFPRKPDSHPDISWLLMTYTLPAEPTAKRVYIWRKFKRLRAELIEKSVWALPATLRNTEELQWLSSEISELGGTAFLWEGKSLLASQSEVLRRVFTERSEEEFCGIAESIDSGSYELAGLIRRYRVAAVRDWFRSPLRERVRKRLALARQTGKRRD